MSERCIEFCGLGPHIGRTIWRSVRLMIGLLVMLIPFFLVSCAPTKPGKPPVPAFNNSALTETLRRGVSTAADVTRALGKPNGSGGFLFPTDKEHRTVWFYEKVRVQASGGKVDLQQDVLLVFFRDNRFDGFLWFSDAAKEW